MKTNQVMLSQDRELYGVKIRQQTKTQMLNISDLQEAYTYARVLNKWSNRGRVNDILAQVENTERIYYILKTQNLINTEISVFMEMVKKQGIVKVLKELKAYITTGRGKNKTTWANSYIWVLLAMELNPEIYAKVVVWLADKLLLNRIEAGNLYKGLTSQISKFKDIDYSLLAKSLNISVFGRHENGIRNTATEEQLNELTRLESNIAFSIGRGYIKDFDSCIKEILAQKMIEV